MSCLQGLDWKMIKRTLTIVGAPTTARELGIEPQYIIKALVQAGEIYPERYTILNEKVLAETSARELARTTGILE
jgi:glycerol-1-phosphate dehydrogenase [NAD(P)+]